MKIERKTNKVQKIRKRIKMIENNMNIKESEDLLDYSIDQLNIFEKEKEYQMSDVRQMKRQLKKSNKKQERQD